MTTMKKPDIGTKMYFVCEHLYCIPNHAGPVKEYCVCEAEVVGFFTGGYTEVQLVGDGRHITSSYRRSEREYSMRRKKRLAMRRP